MPPHRSDLTSYEEDLLKKKLGEYRNKAAAEKATFREALAKHFLAKREVEATDLLIDFFSQVCPIPCALHMILTALSVENLYVVRQPRT